MNFGVSFTNPWALLIGPPLIFYFVWLARYSLADLSLLRRRLAVAIRVLIASLIILALAGMQFVRYNRDLAVMFVVDYSDSISPSAKAAAEKFINAAVEKRRLNDKWGVVVFGREAFIDLAAGTTPSLGKIQTVPPTEFTDIAAAIRLGMASLPDGMRKRLVVLSDGNENLGDALTEAQMASNNEVTIDVVPLASPQSHEVLLEKLTLPNTAKIGEPLDIKVIGRATQDTNAKLKLFRDGKYLGERAVQMTKGKNVFVFPQSVAEAGASTFEAQLESPRGTDTVSENNRALGFVNVQGKPRILLVSDDPTNARFLTQALQSEKVNVEMRGAGGVPSQLRDMQPFDAIILDNVPAWELTEKQMRGLQAYVRDLGCGLVMVGGDASFGPGGYRSTPIEETLPVTMDIKNMQYLPGGAVAMIMHSCEFPQGNDWAKAVCSQVTRQMGDNDWAGLCVFGFDATWVYPMMRVGPNRNYMLGKIRNINPGDMPDFDAALETCYQGLIKTKAYLKHCIILSDGDPSPPRPSLVAKFNAAKITVSTIVIQPHDSSGSRNMWQIAKEHGGRFYQVKKPNEIPNIFLKEAASVSRSAIIEEPFTPRFSDESAIVKGIAKLPPLLGYVGTSSKPTARTVLTSHQDDPILATWQYGLGKSVAFTSDAQQRWAADWLGWSGFSKFWAQAVRWSMRQSSGGDLQTSIDIDKGQGKITIEAVDEKGNFINFLNPKARLIRPDLKGQDLALDQTGPGRYQASFDARQLGTYLVNIRTARGSKTVSQVAGATLPYSPEYNAVGSDLFLLSRLASIGGGQDLELKNPNAVFSRLRRPARSPQDIWLGLLMLATCLFWFDVAIRRILWGETELQNAAKRLRRNRDKPSTPRPPAPRDPRLERLQRAKRASTPVAMPTVEKPPSESSAVTTTPSTPAVPPRETTAPTDAMERLRNAKRRARGEE
jgi:uncharacterized membrane protein